MKTLADRVLSANFRLSEYQCPCDACDGGQPTIDLVNRMQMLADMTKIPLKITSGFRCPIHNSKVGGEPDSQHLFGNAADIACPDSAARYKILIAAAQIGFTGIGIARDYVHVDVGHKDPRCWTYYK